MRRLAIALLLATAPVLAPETAVAQSSATGPDPITVTGENRIVCRRITRTATRMRIGRVCRTQSQWARERGGGVDPNDPNATIDGANDTLTALGANERSTGDSGGFGSGHDTPLGPR
jgi:hypothetical protein